MLDELLIILLSGLYLFGPILLSFFLITKAGFFGNPLIVLSVLYLLNSGYANFIYEHKQANDDLMLFFNWFLSQAFFVIYTVVWVIHRYVNKRNTKDSQLNIKNK